ncbi:MAG: hypothetical protein ACREE7_06575, partial [Dongiaceae bacterium]
MKRLFRDHGIPVVPWLLFLRSEISEAPQRVAGAITRKFRFPIFVKPANLGSSVGITKAHNKRELGPALE